MEHVLRQPRLAVVRGLMYTDPAQVITRWLLPTYRTAFRWTGNRVDSQDMTEWTLLTVAQDLQLPELVQAVDEQAASTATDAVVRHWSTRYAVRPRCDEVAAIEAAGGRLSRPTLNSLFDGLTAEMRLMLVLRFLRRRSPAAIGAQLGMRQDAAARRIIAALSVVGKRLGFGSTTDGSVQAGHLSAYIDDLVGRRRPVRFDAVPEAWPVMIAASQVQAAIAGNDLPERGFVHSLQRRLRLASF